MQSIGVGVVVQTSTEEAEARGSFESKNSQPAQATYKGCLKKNSKYVQCHLIEDFYI
jgi:hypothetical protein